MGTCWALPIRGSGEEDLQGHGETGQLRHAVGHRACGCPEPQEVSQGVHHAPHAEDEEVEPGHRGAGLQQGVDGSEEEEGEDVLHVVAVRPGKGEKVGSFPTGFSQPTEGVDAAPKRLRSAALRMHAAGFCTWHPSGGDAVLPKPAASCPPCLGRLWRGG